MRSRSRPALSLLLLCSSARNILFYLLPALTHESRQNPESSSLCTYATRFLLLASFHSFTSTLCPCFLPLASPSDLIRSVPAASHSSLIFLAPSSLPHPRLSLKLSDFDISTIEISRFPSSPSVPLKARASLPSFLPSMPGHVVLDRLPTLANHTTTRWANAMLCRCTRTSICLLFPKLELPELEEVARLFACVAG